MTPPGVLLDTGPLVALLSAGDVHHARARALFETCAPPFRCCEAVVAEASFLMRRVHDEGPAEVIALARKGVFELALPVSAHLPELEALMRKYARRPISLADASIIRCAEVYAEPRIATFDRDFGIYRWARNRKFAIL